MPRLLAGYVCRLSQAFLYPLAQKEGYATSAPDLYCVVASRGLPSFATISCEGLERPLLLLYEPHLVVCVRPGSGMLGFGLGTVCADFGLYSDRLGRLRGG